MCGRFGNGAERLWRFEFVVKRDEDAMLMASYAKITEIIRPYLTQAGSKYGLVGLLSSSVDVKAKRQQNSCS